MLSNEDPEVVAAAQCTLGEVSGRQGELDDALRWLSLAADSGVADQRTEALFLRGELLTESGDAAGARAAYAELLLEEDEAAVAKAAQGLKKLDGKSTRQ